MSAAPVITSAFDAMELPELAVAITQENARAVRSANTAIDHAVRCGEILIAAKAKVPHGEWETWVSKNTEVTTRTASTYMRLASNRKSISDLEPTEGIVIALELLKEKPVALLPSTSTPPAKAAAVVIDAEFEVVLQDENDEHELPVAPIALATTAPAKTGRIPKYIPSDGMMIEATAESVMGRILKNDIHALEAMNRMIQYCQKQIAKIDAIAKKRRASK